MNQEEKRNIILEHAKEPYHKEIKDNSYLVVNSNNESCIDNITLYIKIDNNLIKEIFFDGEACAITTSTTSIMIKTLEGKTVEEVLSIITNYKNMINQEEYDSNLLEDAVVYDEIYKQPNRKICALLPWNGMERKLKEFIENN